MKTRDKCSNIEEFIDGKDASLDDVLKVIIDAYLDSGTSYNEVIGALDRIKFSINCEAMGIGEE